MRASPDDILGMAFFARVVEARSFSDAARALGVSKSAVSARVARLEQRLGVTLLHRTTRRIALTADGVRLYERCARVVAEADEAAQVGAGASEQPRGTIRVQAPTAFGAGVMVHVVAEFLRAHPGVRVDLRVSDHAPDFASGQLDLAIVLADRLTDSGLTRKRLASVELVVCAAPEYLREKGIPFRPQDLVAHVCIAHALRHGESDLELATDDGTVSFSSMAKLASDDVKALRAAALEGLGIVMLAEPLVREDIETGRLHRVLDDFRTVVLAVHALHPHGRLVPASVRAFLVHLAGPFRALSAPARQAARAVPAATPARARGPRVPITAQDIERLGAVAALYRDVDAEGVARLRQVLARATRLPPERIPRTSVTMNSRVRLRDEAGNDREASLAYPWDTTSRDRVSVLGELGSRLLGARVGRLLGDALTVVALPYQPEAAGDHHL